MWTEFGLEKNSTRMPYRFKACCLYVGGLEGALPLNSAAALRFGRLLAWRFGQGSGLRIDPLKTRVSSMREMGRLLGFSDRLFRLLSDKKASFRRMQYALLIELERVNDFGKFREFVAREICSDGVWAGYHCVEALIYADVGHLAPVISISLYNSAQFIVGQLGGIEQAEILADLAVKFRTKNRTKTLVSRFMALYGSLATLARSKLATLVPARAFLLGLDIGILLILDREDVAGAIVREIKSIAQALNVDRGNMMRLSQVVDRIFYEGKGKEDAGAIVGSLATSIRQGVIPMGR
jgi:hypothetical protein